MQSLFITYCLGDTSGAFLFGCNSIRIIWYCRVKTHLFLGGLVVWGVCGDYRAVALWRLGLLFVGFWIWWFALSKYTSTYWGGGLFASFFGVHWRREILVIFVFQEFDWLSYNFSASSRQHWVYIAKLAIYPRSKRVKQAASKNLPFYSCVVKRVFVGLALVGWHCPQVGNWLHSLLFAM